MKPVDEKKNLKPTNGVPFKKRKSKGKTKTSHKRGNGAPGKGFSTLGENRSFLYLDGKIPVTGDTLLLIPTQLTTNTGECFILREFVVDPTLLGNLNSLDNIFEAAIGRFSTERGYTSTVTPAIIKAYITSAVKSAALFLTLKRNQDFAKIRDGSGRLMGSSLATRMTDTDLDVITTLYSSSSAPGTSAFYQASITNHGWSTSYVSEFENIMLTPVALSNLMEMFSVVHDSYNDDSSIYDIAYPSTRLAFPTPTAILTALQATTALLAAQPDLVSILGILGFSFVGDFNMDWRRDTLQETVLLRKDGWFKQILRTNSVSISWLNTADEAVLTQFNTYSVYDPSFWIPPVAMTSYLDGKPAGVPLDKLTYMQFKMYSGVTVGAALRFVAAHIIYLNSGALNVATSHALIVQALHQTGEDAIYDDASGGPDTAYVTNTWKYNVKVMAYRGPDARIPDSSSYTWVPEVGTTSTGFSIYPHLMLPEATYDRGLDPNVIVNVEYSYYLKRAFVYFMFGVID